MRGEGTHKKSIRHIINLYTQPWFAICKGRIFMTRLVNLGGGNRPGSWNKSLPNTIQPPLMVGMRIGYVIRDKLKYICSIICGFWVE